jgi:putative SOS response-associated peptidase YedK
MCGRFVLISDLSVIGEAFHIDEFAGPFHTAGDRYPGQDVAAVILNGRRCLVSFQWGLTPAWARGPSHGRKLINARGETLAIKPSFRDAFRKRRCLVVADGFYEWDRSSARKRLVCFYMKSGQPFGMAGLYETWQPPVGPPVHSCTIVTTAANELVGKIHDRMPVIVSQDQQDLWLGAADAGPDSLAGILMPYPIAEMAGRAL